MSNPKYNKRKKNRNSSKYQKKIDKKIQERRKSALESTQTEKLSKKKPGTVSLGYVIFIIAILGVAGGVIIYHSIETAQTTPTNTNSGTTQTDTNSGTTQQTTTSTYGFPYSVNSISGTNYKFANYQGKIIVLNFMSVECQYCGPNTNNLVQVYNSLNSSNVVVFELDIGGDSISSLQQYQQEHSIPYILCQDTGLSISSHFTITGTPTTIILNRDGYQYNSLVGLQTVAALTSAIQGALSS